MRRYLAPVDPDAPPPAVRAVPGEGLAVPIWLLGSSDFSARLAGRLGLPYAFASQFAPQNLRAALAIYRDSFQPSEVLSEPYAMVGANVYAADDTDTARQLATSHQQQFLNLIRGMRRPLPTPVPDMDALWSPRERQIVEAQLAASFIGTAEEVKTQLDAFVDAAQPQEVIFNATIFDQVARRRSYEILAGLREGG